MHKILSLLFCILYFDSFSQPPTRAQLLERTNAIDTMVEKVIRDWKIPGVAIGVVYKDEIIYAKGFGYRDLEKKLAVTAHTTFAIASCTKAFTATLVGLAAEKKLLDINKPVHNYFPELEFFTPQLTAMVTPKDMMTHRTGLPRHDWMTNSLLPIPADSVIHRIRYLEPSKIFRDEIQYTNLMYIALGELTRKVTGKPWAQQIQEYIFTPLEMNESSTAFNELDKSKEFSKGYMLRNDSFFAHPVSTEGAHAAGSINSSVSDMCQWLKLWINTGQYKGKQLYAAKHFREAAIPQMSAPSRPNPALPAYPDAFFGDMGYGWVIDSYRGHFHVGHSGDLPAFSSNTGFFPTDSIGIVVLVNKFDATVPELISMQIADRLLALPYKNWNRLLQDLYDRRSVVEAPKSAIAEAVPKMSLPLDAYAGNYFHPGYGKIGITVKDGVISATHNDRPFSITAGGENIFRANVPGRRLKAMIGENGKVISISGSFEAGIADIVFDRK